MNIVLYSTANCGKCMLVKNRLDGKVDYTLVEDRTLILEMARQIDSMEMPILVINGFHYSGKEAVVMARKIVED